MKPMKVVLLVTLSVLLLFLSTGLAEPSQTAPSKPAPSASAQADEDPDEDHEDVVRGLDLQKVDS